MVQATKYTLTEQEVSVSIQRVRYLYEGLQRNYSSVQRMFSRSKPSLTNNDQRRIKRCTIRLSSLCQQEVVKNQQYESTEGPLFKKIIDLQLEIAEYSSKFKWRKEDS